MGRIEIFQRIPDATIILVAKGMYSQHEMWSLDRCVYAKIGSRFARVHSTRTSVEMVVHKVISDLVFPSDKFGRLVLPA